MSSLLPPILIPRDSDKASSGTTLSSPVVIGLLSAAGAALVAIIAVLSWVLLRPGRPRRPPTTAVSPTDFGPRPPIPEEWMAAEPTPSLAPRKPARTATPASDYAFTGPLATATSKPSPLSRDALQNLGRSTGAYVPRPFANSSSRPPSRGVLSHVRAQPLSIGSSVDLTGLGRHTSTASFASSLTPTAEQPAAPTRIGPGAQIVQVTFSSPSRSDEVPLVVGERVTIVDVYADGWVLVMRSSADGALGAAPTWCFVPLPPGAPQPVPPPRTVSIGAPAPTPALASAPVVAPVRLSRPPTASTTDEPGTPGVRQSNDVRQSEMSSFSWSNF